MSQLRFFFVFFILWQKPNRIMGEQIELLEKRLQRGRKFSETSLKLYRNYAKFPGFFGNFQEFSEILVFSGNFPSLCNPTKSQHSKFISQNSAFI